MLKYLLPTTSRNCAQHLAASVSVRNFINAVPDYIFSVLLHVRCIKSCHDALLPLWGFRILHVGEAGLRCLETTTFLYGTNSNILGLLYLTSGPKGSPWRLVWKNAPSGVAAIAADAGGKDDAAGACGAHAERRRRTRR